MQIADFRRTKDHKIWNTLGIKGFTAVLDRRGYTVRGARQKGAVRVFWTDEGDGEGFWTICKFARPDGRGGVEYECTFTMSAPHNFVRAAINAALREDEA